VAELAASPTATPPGAGLGLSTASTVQCTSGNALRNIAPIA